MPEPTDLAETERQQNGAAAATEEPSDEPDDLDSSSEPTLETIRALTDELHKRRMQLVTDRHKLVAWKQAADSFQGRSADLDAGLAKLAEDKAALELQLDEARDGFKPTLERERRELLNRLRAEAEADRARQREELAAERAELAALREELVREIEAANRKAAEAEIATTRAEGTQALLDVTIQGKVSQATKELEQRLRVVEGERDRAQHDLVLLGDELASLRAKAEEADRMRLSLGDRDPESLLEELHRLKTSLARKADKAAEALDRADLEELARLRRERQDRERQIADLRAEVAQLQTHSQSQELELAEAVMRGTVVDGYERLVGEYKRHLDELAARVGQLRESDAVPFPRCSQVAKQTSAPGRSTRARRKRLDLASFVPALQRALYDDNPNVRLRYDLDDLRLEVAGLAASRLHLLQGPSGTGKTSLPVTMARVLGWGVKIIAVQAGWNDRQDLLGYFNTFEGRYQEQDFLVAMYEARTPKFRDAPYLIVLDEANLSYIERYFADFLMLLSSPDPQKRISITPGPQVGAPDGLQDGHLELSPNVWFVATANQDETTVGFAPKTVDRGHVMELVRRPGIRIAQSSRVESVGLAELEAAFDLATEAYRDRFDPVLADIDEVLGPNLADLGLVYAERLSQYGSRFLPVLLAANGDEATGVDHILTTKVLYRLRGRVGLDRNELKKLETALENVWTKRRYSSPPSRCLGIVHECLRAAERGW